MVHSELRDLWVVPRRPRQSFYLQSVITGLTLNALCAPAAELYKEIWSVVESGQGSERERETVKECVLNGGQEQGEIRGSWSREAGIT